MTKDNRRFVKRGDPATSGVYTCWMCGKKTRETGEGESSFELCKRCLHITQMENEHFDYGHPEHHDDCPECIRIKEKENIK
jgi:hypothetical protein